MGILTAFDTILRRQNKSGGEKLLDLLKDPYADQVIILYILYIQTTDMHSLRKVPSTPV